MKNLLLNCAIFVFSILCTIPCQAKHIVGGTISYECEGNDNYTFTLTIYRDCTCENCAYFDNVASIGIYACGDQVDCNDLVGHENPFLVILASLDTVMEIAQNPICSFDTAVCLEEGRYIFSANLPQSIETYHIAYQRCCRSIEIDNIIDSEENGATYTIQLTPSAQSLCNTSPVFNIPPPPIIHVNETMNYDYSVIDAEGDSLVYIFCAPLNGGGNILTDLYATCEGAAPSPACAPPYDDIVFSDNFTALTPIPGDPIITIDATTGIITGTPNLLGKFVVGVCVEEYRNEQLLSTSFHDFQFIVGNCVPNATNQLESYKGFTIYPNPSHHKITLSTIDNSYKNKTFALFSLTGKVVAQQILPLGANTISIDIEQIPTGIYFWKVTSSNEVLDTGKLVIQ